MSVIARDGIARCRPGDIFDGTVSGLDLEGIVEGCTGNGISFAPVGFSDRALAATLTIMPLLLLGDVHDR